MVYAAAASESVNFPSAPRQAGSVVQLSGYLYRPDGPGPFPAVVMLHGCSGLMTHSGKMQANARFWAEHLRDHGYVALLVDSFTARGIDEVCTGRQASRRCAIVPTMPVAPCSSSASVPMSRRTGLALSVGPMAGRQS